MGDGESGAVSNEERQLLINPPAGAQQTPCLVHAYTHITCQHYHPVHVITNNTYVSLLCCFAVNNVNTG